MVSKLLLITLAIAYVEARFGQEQIPIPAIGAVQGGAPGAAGTISGAAISDLLGAANSCAKLQRADQVVSELGGGADAIAAAIGLVTAEKNTNPFANGNVQNVCGDPSLPATAELRGITPLIDPDVDAGGAAAALSASSAASPLNADGLSVFDLMSAAGLGDLVVSQAAAGGAAAGAAGAGNANAGNAGAGNAGAGNANAGNAGAGNADAGAAAGRKAGGNAAGGNAAGGNAAAGNAAAGNGAACNAGNAAAGNGTAAAGGNQNAGNGNAGNNNAGNNNGNAGNGNAGNGNAGNNNAGNGNAGNNKGNAGNGNAGNANAGNDNAGNGNAGNGNANQDAGNNAGNNANQGAADNNNNQGANNNDNANAGAGAAGGAAAGGAADFGQCTPTIDLAGGRGNRPADELTFQITDPLARGGQQEALNPNIITNALCNQLTNVCGANAAAIAKCEDAKAQVAAAGTRDQSTADLFNSAIGFGGAAKRSVSRSMRRGLRL